MTYKTILVHIDDSPRSGERVEFAAVLARKYDAHLVGLYIAREDVLSPPTAGSENLDLGASETRHARLLQRARDDFASAIEHAGCKAEWRAPAGPASETAIAHARHADLVVLGQDDPDDPAAHVAAHFVEDIVMSAGRPVLVLPRSGRIATFGENVVVAWDGGREAARALADALPLLEHARFVTVAAVEKHGNAPTPTGFDVAKYLERHRIRAGFVTLPRAAGMRTGATILDQLAERHADLLVMGAYGHARALERVLGGVTRTMLETMMVPIFMSH